MAGGYYNLKREIGVPIPEIIDPDDWCLFTMCVPNHPDWFLAVRNAVRFLTLGRYWLRDDRENSIKQAQSMGEEILRSLDMCTIDFTALAASLDNIAASLANIQTNVTVTQNCGSGGGSLVCIGEDGTPIVNPPPIEPDPIPPGGDWPVDPGVDPPPGEDEDWSLFDARACAVSNSIYQLLVYLTIALEGIIDSLVTLAAGIIALLALFPAAAAAAIGGASIIEIVGALVDLLSIETIADVLQEARQWVEDHQADIVCLIYSYRYDLPGMRVEFATQLVLGVTAVVSLTPDEQTRLREFAKKWLPLSLLFRWFYEGGAYIDALNPYDCSLCDEPMPAPETDRLYWLPHESISLVDDVGGLATMTVVSEWEWHIGGSIPGSSFTWDPIIQGEVPAVPAGHEVLGWAAIWVTNYSTAGNDPNDHLIRYNGLVKFPGWKYLRFDTNRDEDLVTNDPVLSAYFDEYNTASGTFSGTYSHGYYRRAGVSGSGGVVEGIQIQFGWLVKRPA